MCGGGEGRMAGPADGYELGGPGREQDNEMRVTAFEATLKDGKRLATERMVCCGNADMFDVSSIQLRSMLVVVQNATSGKAW